jgi:hypothetical protein
MGQLLQKLQDEHGIDPEQGHGILNTVLQFIKDKVPMASGDTRQRTAWRNNNRCRK